jgi:hypothetical protein
VKLFAALLLVSTLAAAAPPVEINARYTITTGSMTIGNVTETFARKGDTYTIQSVTRSEGMLRMFVDDEFTAESAGRVDSKGLLPLSYSEHRAKDNKRDLRSDFDWDKGVVRTRLHGESSEVALPTETQDRISTMYQFMSMKKLGESFVLPMSDRRKVEMYTYRFVDAVKLATPAGQFDTLHYERVAHDPNDMRAEVWLARDRSNFPVRVVFDDPKRFRLEQTIVSLDIK